MKKLLGFFGTSLLVGTPVITVISCNKAVNNGKDEENITDENDKEIELSAQEKEIIKNTELFTKLLLLARHENLNFNVNEVFSALFAPRTTWNAFPRLYNVNGKKYDLTEYTDKLTTEYSNLTKLNASGFEAFLPSNLIGMYKNKLYTNYVNGIKESGNSALFDYNATDINRPENNNRQQLAWANFTGPLSKYIVDNDLFYYGFGDDNRIWLGRFLDEANIGYPSLNMVLTEDKTAFKVKDGLDLPVKLKIHLVAYSS